MTSVRSPFATPTERLATYFDVAQPRPTFEDRDIDEIAVLLGQCGHVASKCPRTYILFRTIGHLDTLEQLVRVGFSDQWFPVESRSLPSFLEPSVKSEVVKRQGLILTKSLDLENGRHRHFAPEEALPFEILGRLGSGAYGQVDRIQSRISFQQYALKRVRRRVAFGNTSSREAVEGFLNEMKILKSLEHEHIVRYIGSYTDKTYLGLVISPVAEADLATYNEHLCGYLQAVQGGRNPPPPYMQNQPAAIEMASNLRTFFGCLTAALTYLHDRSIRHKDIKPQNILVAKGSVLFSDFGLSRDFADDVGSTTSGVTPASARYWAPEVARYEARNTSSDIWSLGCVFLEMTAALQGLNVEWIKEFFLNSHSNSAHFHTNPAATTQLIRDLEATGDPKYKRTLTWIEKMVLLDRSARPTAARVLKKITSSETSDADATPNMFCGICCVPDFDSDSVDSLADDFEITTGTSRQHHDLNMGKMTQLESRDPEMEAENLNPLMTGVDPHVQTSNNGDTLPQSAIAVSHTEALYGNSEENESSFRAPLNIEGPSNTKAIPDVETPMDIEASADTSAALDTSSSSPWAEGSRQTDAPSHTKAVLDNTASLVEELTGKQVVQSEPSNDNDSRVVPSRPLISNQTKAATPVSQKVFGTSLSVSIKYASVDLIKHKTVGGAYIEGPIPCIVAKCCELIRIYSPDECLLIDWTKVRGVAVQLSHESLRPKFNTYDYGRQYSWGRGERIDCGRLLYIFLASLPELLIPADAIQEILHTWRRSLAAEQNLRLLRTTLLNIPAPYRLVVLYMLDTFVLCGSRSITGSRDIARQYYRCFLGRGGTLDGNDGASENFSIFHFMIVHAQDLLGDQLVSEHNSGVRGRPQNPEKPVKQNRNVQSLRDRFRRWPSLSLR